MFGSQATKTSVKRVVSYNRQGSKREESALQAVMIALLFLIIGEMSRSDTVFHEGAAMKFK